LLGRFTRPGFYIYPERGSSSARVREERVVGRDAMERSRASSEPNPAQYILPLVKRYVDLDLRAPSSSIAPISLGFTGRSG